MTTKRFLGVLIVLLAFAACHNKSETPAPQPQPFSAKLVKPVDASDLETHIKAELASHYERWKTGYLYSGIYSMGGAVATTNDTVSNNPTSAGGSADTTHSETNVQEKGVDEGDLVKTDGMFIYLARGAHFLVLRANPASQTSIVSDINLAEPISEIYLSNSLVTVITNTFIYTPMPGKQVTRLYNYDVSSPAAPVLTNTFDIPGYSQGSRRIADTLYLVTNYTIDIPDPVSCWDYMDKGSMVNGDTVTHACDQALQENLKRIDTMSLDELLPTYTETRYTSGVAGTPITGPAVAYGDVYLPESGNGVDLALVISIDLAGTVPAISSTSAVFSSWCRLYMSPDSLFLASDNRWRWIEPVVGSALPPSNPEPRTAIHKFSVVASTNGLSYRGSGVVEGWVNDRFSMGEYLGYLRVGTTRGGWWGETTSNQLTVLAENNGALEKVGSLTGLALGEQIYSMRYDRDRGYLVTFHQTDPLFTLDLSDPVNPRVAGEIKVNGFATYIHLLGTDNSRLLTIGRSADATGRATGNKLQLFSVGDLAAPALRGEYELGPGWSDALYDPHAFLYYEPLGLLTIPYFSYGNGTGNYQSGLQVFTIGSATISLKGTIPAKVLTTGYGAYQDTVDRSVIIGSSIYSVAHRSVTVAGTDKLDIITTVDLPESYNYPIVGGGTVPVAQKKGN